MDIDVGNLNSFANKGYTYWTLIYGQNCPIVVTMWFPLPSQMVLSDGVVWGSLQKESTSLTFQSIHQTELSPLTWAIKLCLIAHTSPPTLFALYRQQFSLPWTKVQNGTLPSSTLTYLPLWVPNIYSQHHSMIFGSQKQACKEQSFLTLQLTRLHP